MPPPTAPWLRSDRLELWRPVPADARAALQIMSDERVIRHNPSDRVQVLGQAEAVVARWIAHWDRYDFGYTCVREAGAEAVIGFCGLVRARLGGQSALNLMYRFRPSVWGQGVATEAATAVVSWAGRNLPGEVILGRTRPANRASQRVLIKAGLQRDPDRDDIGADGPDLLFSTGTAQ